MKKFYWVIFLLLPFAAIAQQLNLDSLVRITESMKNDSSKVLNLVTITNKYRTEKIDYPNAKKYALQAVGLSEKILFYKGSFKSTIALGYVTRDMGLHHEGIELLKKAINIFEGNKELTTDAGLFQTHVYTHTALADLYTYLPDYKNAQQYAFKALELSEKYNIGIGQCWITLSIIFSKQKNMAEAQKYALKARDYFQQQNALDDLARAYAYLARYAYTAEDYANAVSYYQASYGTYKQANSLFGMRIALYNLAEIHLKTKDYLKANHYIDETLKINSVSKDDVVYQFYINQLKFEITLGNKAYAEAITVGNLLVDYAIKEKNQRKLSGAYGNLFSAYLATKDTANAFVMSEKISALKDSLYNADLAKGTADLAKKYETEKKEQQIAFLDKENRFNQERLSNEMLLSEALKNENLLKEGKIYQEHLLGEIIERENVLKNSELAKGNLLNKSLQSENTLLAKNSRMESLVRWLMAALLLGFIIFGLNYFLNYRRQKQDNKKILKQSEELKVLMSEVHHRVKNNLQVIMAMLRMQARSIDNQFAIEALVNSENRLQAIATVHEKLYKSGSQREVSLKEYLQELTDVLMTQHPSNEITCTVQDSTALTTNLDTAIPLGLIVNELVTNSFKYAFTGTQKAAIGIQLSNSGNNAYQLTVSDNGIGLPNGSLPQKNTTLGLKLVRLFTEQLNGQLSYYYHNGSCFTIDFKPLVTAQ
jgi:two-component sensor histidine kinase